MVLPIVGAGLGWLGLGTGIAAGATAITGAIPGLKEELGLGEKSRAKAEINQGREKGYDFRTGEINRGLIERATDGLLGNDPQKILEAAQARYKENLDTDFGNRITKVNQQLTELNQAGANIEITERSDPKKIERELKRLEAKIPKLQEAETVSPGSGATINSSDAELGRITRAGIRDENNNAAIENPIYRQQLKDARLDRITADKRFNATQQLAIGQMALAQQNSADQLRIAQMNNELQMRREDSADRRADRKDRQMMIMQLMKGLSAMGGAMAI